MVGRDVVRIYRDMLVIGKNGYKLSEVNEYADAGANLPLPNGCLLQAAIAMLVVAAAALDSDEECKLLAGRIDSYARKHDR
jgi:hypothetical protein